MSGQHNVQITAAYRTRGTKTLTFNFMPDSFKLPVKSTVERMPIALTSSQFLIYQGTPPPEISLSLKVVAGLEDFHIDSRADADTKDVSDVGIGSMDYLAKLKVFTRELYALALPEANITAAGSIPPPKCVLSVGSIFRGVGMFDSIDIEHFGPYDDEGRPCEIEVSFNFLPSQFYDPKEGKNPVGVNVPSNKTAISTTSDARTALQNIDTAKDQTMSQNLMLFPSGSTIGFAVNDYTIYYGGK